MAENKDCLSEENLSRLFDIVAADGDRFLVHYNEITNSNTFVNIFEATFAAGSEQDIIESLRDFKDCSLADQFQVLAVYDVTKPKVDGQELPKADLSDETCKQLKTMDFI